jgi:hypothetical protein
MQQEYQIYTSFDLGHQRNSNSDTYWYSWCTLLYKEKSLYTQFLLAPHTKHPRQCNTQMFNNDYGKIFLSDGNLEQLYLQYLILTL